MTQDKMRRIITACTAAVTALLVFLLTFLVYQWITIASLNKKIDKVRAEITYQEQLLATQEGTLAYYKTEAGLQLLYQKLIELEGKK